MTSICIKLITGEELIGTLEEDLESKPEYINVLNPVKVIPSYDSDGNFGIYFQPFMSYCDQSLFTFASHDIIIYSYPTKQMTEQYTDYVKKYEQLNTEEFGLGAYSIKSSSMH